MTNYIQIESAKISQTHNLEVTEYFVDLHEGNQQSNLRVFTCLSKAIQSAKDYAKQYSIPFNPQILES